MPKKAKFDIGAVIRRLEQEKWKEPTDKETAKKIGIARAIYSELKHGWRSPTFKHLRLLCRYFDEPLATFLADDHDLLAHGTGPVRWSLRAGLRTSSLRTTRDVTEAVLMGESPEAIARRLVGNDADAAAFRRAEARVLEEVRSGLHLGIVGLVIRDLADVQDPDLATELGDALSQLAGRPVTAWVVRDVAHRGFERDPIAPHLIARVAHAVVARTLGDDAATATIGIAGGMHLGAFVRSIGPASSPFPDGSARHYVFVPLTLEPFHDHRFELADALVATLHGRAASLLGDARVQAPSFTPFGYVVDGKIAELDTRSIVRVREQYLHLDVAVFGCGDGSDEGWIEWMQRVLSFRPVPPPVTDVCMHFISATSELIPFPDGRRPLGVPLEEIRRLASKPGKLALLLASGESKGRPITLVARAGCTNAVVCDEAAARAALRSARSEDVPRDHPPGRSGYERAASAAGASGQPRPAKAGAANDPQ